MKIWPQSSEHQSAISHQPALDGLRGCAALMVLVHHYGLVANFEPQQMTALDGLVRRLLFFGWTGVDLFFVLSGFLITSILLASRNDPSYYKLFYTRRALRILPLYYLVAVIGIYILPRLGKIGQTLAGDAHIHQIWIWTYTVNIGMLWGRYFGSLDVLWSLAIEEQFYIFWPLLVHRLKPKTLGCAAFLLMGLGLAIRIVWILRGAPLVGVYRFTLTRLDGLAVGAFLACLHSGSLTLGALPRRMLTVSAYLLIAGLGVLLIWCKAFYPTEPAVAIIGYLALSGAFGSLLISALQPGSLTQHLMNNSALRLVGKYSYGIYVFHWPIREALLFEAVPAQLVNRVGTRGGAFLFCILGIILSLLTSMISFHLYEKRLLSLKRYFNYNKASPPRRIPDL